jgi:hypothetical protein
MAKLTKAQLNKLCVDLFEEGFKDGASNRFKREWPNVHPKMVASYHEGYDTANYLLREHVRSFKESCK